jgi:carboxypeptidase C (cathepsin A)
VLLGSFAPMRLKTRMPDFTPPAPYTVEPNPDSLLDKSDLVFEHYSELAQLSR